MQVFTGGAFITIRLSAHDTYAWAHRTGASWPCSHYSGKRVRAEFDARNGDLVDLLVDGKYDDNAPSDELNAMISDFAGKRFPVLVR